VNLDYYHYRYHLLLKKKKKKKKHGGDGIGSVSPPGRRDARQQCWRQEVIRTRYSLSAGEPFPVLDLRGAARRFPTPAHARARSPDVIKLKRDLTRCHLLLRASGQGAPFFRLDSEDGPCASCQEQPQTCRAAGEGPDDSAVCADADDDTADAAADEGAKDWSSQDPSELDESSPPMLLADYVQRALVLVRLSRTFYIIPNHLKIQNKYVEL
jgi:hypothetical protein